MYKRELEKVHSQKTADINIEEKHIRKKYKDFLHVESYSNNVNYYTFLEDLLGNNNIY